MQRLLLSHRLTHALQIAERLRPDLGDLRRVEIERGHAFEQQVGRLRATLGDGTEIGRGHAHVVGDTLDFQFAAA